MVGSLFVPFAIFIGAAATAALTFFAFFGSVQTNAVGTVGKFAQLLDRAGIRSKPEQLVFTWLTVTSAIWILAILLFKPALVIGLVFLIAAAGAAAVVLWAWVNLKVTRRTEAFLNQHEVVLRLMSSGLRSGLGIQQTLAMVIEEAEDPARYEFARVLGQANIGASIHDALDDLAQRIRTSEALMMARVIRINSQTGGDLAYVLEQLANTIRERRRMRRKVKSLTAEGRAGAIVLGAVPVLLGTFILTTQRDMSNGLLHLPMGHIILAIVVVLEVLGVFTLSRMLKVAV